MNKKYAPIHNSAPGHVIKINGIEMYYEEYGEGNPLVLLHGFGGCSQNWYPFTKELSKYFKLIVIDLRGHGYSSNPENTFTHKEAANDVFMLLEKLGIDQFSAMGMSTGGMVLLHMATSKPRKIQSMVLISATSHFPDQARYIMRRASYTTLPTDVKEMYQECAKRGEEQIKQLLTQFKAFAENSEDMNFTAESLSTIKARTLVIHGDRDTFFPTEIAVTIQQNIPNSALWIIPNGDHVPIYNSIGEFTTRAIDFLENR
jgi:pimeloyl-ACP methyl ester carboxylesterase